MASSTKSGGRAGFTLIEVLVAVSLLTIVMVGGFSANSLAANSAGINKLRSQANLLAREGMEALASVRAADFTSLSPGTFHPVNNSGLWVLSPGEEILTKYTRKIVLTPVMRDMVCSTPVCDIVSAGGKTDPYTYKATVTVGWKENDEDKSFALNSLITYWR